jgi:hypothetical protein
MGNIPMASDKQGQNGDFRCFGPVFATYFLPGFGTATKPLPKPNRCGAAVSGLEKSRLLPKSQKSLPGFFQKTVKPLGL